MRYWNGRRCIRSGDRQLVGDIGDLVDPDNLVGMTLGPRLPDGSYALILVSDNNFNPSQTTQFILLSLDLKTHPAQENWSPTGEPICLYFLRGVHFIRQQQSLSTAFYLLAARYLSTCRIPRYLWGICSLGGVPVTYSVALFTTE